MKKSKLYARWIAHTGVRNTFLEDLHAGRELPRKYKGHSRLNDREMRQLMLEVEKNIELILTLILGLEEHGELPWEGKQVPAEDVLKQLKKAFFGKAGVSWDIPKKEWDSRLKVGVEVEASG